MKLGTQKFYKHSLLTMFQAIPGTLKTKNPTALGIGQVLGDAPDFELKHLIIFGFSGVNAPGKYYQTLLWLYTA